MDDRRTCLVCGTQFPTTTEYCPVCILREALDVGAESGESSSEDTVTPAPEDAALRFEHYELEKGEDGMTGRVGSRRDGRNLQSVRRRSSMPRDIESHQRKVSR